ncbi:MAG: hypothetical protein WA208_09385 [Thermoanaerobaculia bacterium]
MRPSRIALLLFVSALACNRAPAVPEDQQQWHEVLKQKRAATAPDASPQQKQIYADSVRAFVQRNPHHGRGREVWQRMQLEFADQLFERARYRDSVRFYRAVLDHDPINEHARRGLTDAVDRLAVTREKLLLLEKGMSHREVTQILGKPIPGWIIKKKAGGVDMEAWYYRTTFGSLAAVHFREGDVLAAEEDSGARIGRLGS